MKRLLALLLVIMTPLLWKRTLSQDPENQAYVIAMGVDETDVGFRLTVRVPNVGQAGAQSSDTQEGSDAYLRFYADGDTYAGALYALQCVVPREINLSHLKLLAVSQSLAGTEGFHSLVNQIAETHHLYTAAKLVVCEGRAEDYIDAQSISIGTRLSVDLQARLEHYALRGMAPRESLADLYFAFNAPYGDAVAIWVANMPLNGSDETPQSAQSPPPGTALFREARLAMVLDERDTFYFGLMSGSVATFERDCGGRIAAFTLRRPPRRRVRIDGNDVRVQLSLSYSTVDPIETRALDALREELRLSMQSLFERCQAEKLDPFGFSELAAWHFPTLNAFQAFDWRERYAAACVELSINIERE